MNEALCNRTSVWCFRLACVVLLLTAAAHTMGHLSPEPPPRNEAERQLMQLMKGVPIEAPGATMTAHGLLTGFSWQFAISLATMGATGIVLGWSRDATPTVRRRLAAVMLAALMLMTISSQVYFFAIPTVMIGASTLLMGASVVLAGEVAKGGGRGAQAAGEVGRGRVSEGERFA